ncbi:DUF1835 domain-containing protein [Terasakiella sp. A23]|uniref:DUF1835 domain-containing protein n=1 Tax=Terasakiella sp. FCG-A23 TaxID=3080561 RepID=UPI002955599E|nr:DUF1835 domain-containing protein [Terasakiella sp. A23]MDV7340536.1 DUF1835 domain-containing protein [Terasakiella sp. A23]
MSDYIKAPIVGLTQSSHQNQFDLSLEAELLLEDIRQQDPIALNALKENHPLGGRDDFTPTLQDARMVVMRQNLSSRKLSLDKMKKEAKSLLKAVKAKQPLALMRVKDIHPKIKNKTRSLIELTLADMHHILALENGFDSWPKLKHHLEALKQISSREYQPDTKKNLHLRCGDDIKPALSEAGFIGTFKEVINPFVIGPVTAPKMTGEALSLRQKYMRDKLGHFLPPERQAHMDQDLVEEQSFVQNLPADFDQITLWFEHDAYDQLCLTYLLYHLADKDLPPLEIVQIDHFPGVKRFTGIGQISGQKENLRLLYQQRVTVTPDMIRFGRDIWKAYTSSDPRELWHLSQIENAPLPLMQQAIIRMLSELPSPHNGLGLCERLVLDILSREETMVLRRLFLFCLAENDPQPYHGDLTFFASLDHLWESEQPALQVIGKIDTPDPFEGKEILKLTAYGEKLVKGEVNWLADNPTTRWIGGIKVDGSQDQNWVFDGSEPYLAKTS